MRTIQARSRASPTSTTASWIDDRRRWPLWAEFAIFSRRTLRAGSVRSTCSTSEAVTWRSPNRLSSCEGDRLTGADPLHRQGLRPARGGSPGRTGNPLTAALEHRRVLDALGEEPDAEPPAPLDGLDHLGPRHRQDVDLDDVGE